MKKHIEGKNDKKVMLYALSTCPWCHKTKNLLGELGVGYDFIDVDLLDLEEDARTTQEIMKFTSDISFPILIIDDEKVIQGFDEEQIREALK